MNKEIAQKIARSKHFKWMAGMLNHTSLRVLESYVTFMHPTDLPDYTDAATFGCLLYLARQTLNDSSWYPTPINDIDEITIIQKVLDG